MTDGIGKVGCSIADEALERVADAGDAAVVVQHEHIGKADEHKEIQEAGHIESLTTLGGCKGLLNSKPDEHDGGE